MIALHEQGVRSIDDLMAHATDCRYNKCFPGFHEKCTCGRDKRIRDALLALPSHEPRPGDVDKLAEQMVKWMEHAQEWREAYFALRFIVAPHITNEWNYVNDARPEAERAATEVVVRAKNDHATADRAKTLIHNFTLAFQEMKDAVSEGDV